MLRNPIASPPIGKPGRDEVFQAIRSTCAQFVFLSINLFRNNAAVIAPPVPDDPVLLIALLFLSSCLL